MSSAVQGNTAYAENSSVFSNTEDSLPVVPVDVVFNVLPAVLANDQLMSAVADNLLQGIGDGQTSFREQPQSQDEQIMQDLLNMNRQWVAMAVIQQVYESNMRVLHSISGVKSEANHFLSRSDDYFTNPFISLSLIDQMNSDSTVPDNSAVSPYNGENSNTLESGRQFSQISEQDLYNQLLETLTQQWLDLQNGQTGWQTLSNGLDSLVHNNALTNNRLDNQNTSRVTQINGSDLQSILMNLQNLL